MDNAFQAAYQELNPAQQQAVDSLDGPLLVLAGPGTGKTKLLATRAANLLATGLAMPSNILCLTYTESGAQEMRERLTRIIGPNGSEIAVQTFHSFGTWLIAQYPEVFTREKSLTPLDNLGRYRIFAELLGRLPLRHPFAIRDENENFVRQGAVVELIRASKQAGYTPEALEKVLVQNQLEYKAVQPLLDEIFTEKLSAKRLEAIQLSVGTAYAAAKPGSYTAHLLTSLMQAIEESQLLGKTAPLGGWRSSYTTIKNGQRLLKSAASHDQLVDGLKLYRDYQTELTRLGRFDYEDMVLWAAEALEHSQDLRFDLAEKFQYIMVDEYQDTNGAQNRLLDNLLSAHPTDSPNIMVVGDDDQAIMRFQGAELSGVLQFVERYEPSIVVLQENYRSPQTILDAARDIMTQTDERLESLRPELGLHKQLTARATRPGAKLQHQRYISQSASLAGVVDTVEKLLKNGTPANEIAIIGRKHQQLVEIAPYLQEREIHVDYDRREDVLRDDTIHELLLLSQLIARLADDPQQAEAWLPEVLSANYWHLPPLDTYYLARAAREAKTSWLQTMLDSDNPDWQHIAQWLIAAAGLCHTKRFSEMFDIVLGREPIVETSLKQSPFISYLEAQNADNYVRLLSHLICLRNHILGDRSDVRSLDEALDVIEEYRRSGLQMVDDNPVLRGSGSGVQLVSAHGAKGREFDHVFIIGAIDEVWGSRARAQTQRIRLPENLPLYAAGDTTSDRLRLLYVAMTRARSELTLVSYEKTDAGKAVTPLSYLQLEAGSTSHWWQPAMAAEPTTIALKTTLESSWRPLHAPSPRELQEVLQPLLNNYAISASAMRTFLDIRYGGPLACIEQHILRFPAAYNAHSALGQATHRTLQLALEAYKTGKKFTDKQLLARFDAELLSLGLSDGELQTVREHGHAFLPAFVSHFTATDFAHIIASEEYLTATLPNSGLQIAGSVDAIASQQGGQLTVIDYKTGTPPPANWETKGLSDGKKVAQHFYRQQLLCYKLLVDNARQYKGSSLVTTADLVFVEPNENGEFIRLSITEFDTQELARTEKLLQIIRDHLVNGSLPDTSQYSQDLKGILAFETDLLA